ncbi:MAG: DUF3300 domain-containing protein [Candidatus Acidiferrales bacterium]
MRKSLVFSIALLLLCLLSLAGSSAAAAMFQDPQDQPPPQDQQPQQDQQAQADQSQQDQAYQPYTADQLDNLLAPIALYPDPLLAQVLPASTFPDQIDAAARYVRSYGQNGVDDQPWDVSVKSVAHYPTVLDMMDSKLDWTTAVGQAYVNQSTDVMTSVQRLRSMAQSQGNLASTPQQQVVDSGGYIQIWPAQPQYIYVPVYDPAIVYYRRPAWGYAVAFGAGFAIGAWLNYDCDWRGRRVYYQGWGGRDDNGWVRRSRPYVQVNNRTYINNTYTNITVNKTVINRTVNVNNINNYKSVHKNVTYNNVARNNVVVAKRTDVRVIAPAARTNNRVNNAVINRNINTSDPKLNQYRGRPAPVAAQARPAAPAVNRPRPGQPSNARPAARPFVPPNRPYQPAGRAAPAAPARAQYQPSPAPHAFGRSETNFKPSVASQRGQASRAQAARPPAPRYNPPPARPAARQSAPRPASRPASRPAPSRPHGGKP